MGGENPPIRGRVENFTKGAFFSDSGHLRKSTFDHSSFFQSKKHQSKNIEHQLKSKLA